jgi:LuxR family transcriptional regulator, maltose regulon positive regulatory protein
VTEAVSDDLHGAGRLPVPRIKTAVPLISPRYLYRPRLLSLLDGAGENWVVLVGAPAGYGKTLLLAEWAARRPERTAWVNLDADDNDDRRFWSSVLAALGSCRVVTAGDPLRSLVLPSSPSRDPLFLAAVVDAIDALPDSVTLVLDDVHELTAADPLHGLAALLRDRPAGLQLVLSTRLDPPLRLSRLRLTGQLCEVRAPDLAFRLDEAQAMLSTADVAVRPEHMAVLFDQTDGWAAGLRLAALSMRESDDVEPFLSDLVGSGRAISDYLVGEILSRLAPDVVEVIGALSICDELTAPLAVAVSGRDEAGDVLAALERETSLVTSYGAGRRWFRIHPLLRAQLRADLERRLPDRVATLHERAARWLIAAADPAEALRHARLTGDGEHLTAILREHGADLAGSGHHAAVRAAVDALPRATLEGDPYLALVAALAHLEVGRLATTDGYRERADAVWPDAPGPELVSLGRSSRAGAAGTGRRGPRSVRWRSARRSALRATAPARPSRASSSCSCRPTVRWPTVGCPRRSGWRRSRSTGRAVTATPTCGRAAR